ncbi:hypothetical protein GY45DRAFT_1341349 [Cubamyces sp. BRFM 1775]|nr:hypothetical protein GY45DRAFT_1341349 [Cubamyces sp. BRFM 1775]
MKLNKAQCHIATLQAQHIADKSLLANEITHTEETEQHVRQLAEQLRGLMQEVRERDREAHQVTMTIPMLEDELNRIVPKVNLDVVMCKGSTCPVVLEAMITPLSIGLGYIRVTPLRVEAHLQCIVAAGLAMVTVIICRFKTAVATWALSLHIYFSYALIIALIALVASAILYQHITSPQEPDQSPQLCNHKHKDAAVATAKEAQENASTIMLATMVMEKSTSSAVYHPVPGDREHYSLAIPTHIAEVGFTFIHSSAAKSNPEESSPAIQDPNAVSIDDHKLEPSSSELQQLDGLETYLSDRAKILANLPGFYFLPDRDRPLIPPPPIPEARRNMQPFLIVTLFMLYINLVLATIKVVMLLRLLYWEPTCFALVNAMHKLFLHHHCINIWGIKTAEDRGKPKRKQAAVHTPEEQQSVLDRLVAALRLGPLAAMRAFRKDYLEALICPSLSQSLRKSRPTSTNDEFEHTIFSGQVLEAIRRDIESTTRPSWLLKPPCNLGSASHGKLKADHWRTACTVNMVITFLFGPTFVWWAFPSERYNGLLQRLNTNHKLDIPKMFMHYFYIRARSIVRERVLLAAVNACLPSNLKKYVSRYHPGDSDNAFLPSTVTFSPPSPTPASLSPHIKTD